MMTHTLRVLGAALVALSLIPFFRILPLEEDAPVRAAQLGMARATLDFAWWGGLVVLLVAILLSRIAPDLPRRLGRAVGSAVAKPSPAAFAAGVGASAAGVAAAVAGLLYRGLLTNVDEMASLIHARFLGRGMLAGPTPVLPEGWLIPNTLMVPEGWVSQYPPSHLAVLAVFERLGMPLAVGPVLFGVMAGTVALTLPRLVPGRERTMRAAAALTALSPLLLFIAGGMLSHLTAGVAVAGAAYCVLRARDGRPAWALAAGAAIGVAVSARPLTGLVLGTLFPVALWWRRAQADGLAWGARRVLALAAGGIPFAVALGVYNARLFGAATRWGYLAAFGADHGLGFHADPWGYAYGPIAALALTSTDMIRLGVQLLETPFPITTLLGAWLLVGPRMSRGVGVLVAWALLPVAANALYWFHGPRMYFEAAPAWIALVVLSVVGLAGGGAPYDASRIAGSEAGRPVSAASSAAPGAHRVGPVLGWAVVMGVVWSVGWGVPIRWSSYAWDDDLLEAVRAPEVPDGPRALVFVHTPWTERISATLQGAGGMRQDSVTTALRRNGACALHEYAVARERLVRGGRDVALPDVDLERRSGAPETLTRRRTRAGSVVRARVGEAFTPPCRRELAADRFGTVALAPLVWQGDLPGDERGRPMFVRDLGPAKNARIRAVHSDRAAFVFVPTAVGAPPELVAYEEAMRMLWGGG